MLVQSRFRIGSISGSNPFCSILNPLRSQIHSPSETPTLQMAAKINSKRPICPSCSKPARTCLCSRIPVRGLENKVGVTILQHSLERKHPLNSTRIATLGLKNLTVASVSDVNSEAQLVIRLLESVLDRNGMESLDIQQGLGYRETPMCVTTNSKKKTRVDPIGTIEREKKEDCVVTATIGKYGLITSLTHVWMSQTHSHKPNFDHILSSPQALDALGKGFIVKKLQKRQASEEEEEFEVVVPPGSVLLFPSERSVGAGEIDFEVKNLIVLDGTWAKAKRMYKENPWLKLLPHLKLEVEEMSLYSEVRQQPKAGYLSTIESIVYSLKAFGDNPDGLDGLLDVFESMIGDQRQCKDERLRTASLL